jgi:drug/metabolite transporter (DMT)-like permease
VARVPVLFPGPVQAPQRTGRSAPKGKNPRGKSRKRLCVSGSGILSLTAFLLVTFASLAHATWNFLAKRAAHSKHLIWFSSTTEALVFAPLAVWVLAKVWSSLGLRAALFLLATGVLHLLYTESLLRGYRAGDLTVVYPLARGTGPLLSFCGAVLLLHERPSLLAGAGAVLITLGILLSSGGLSALRHAGNHAGLFWGVATGCMIASYTLVDGYSVKTLLLSPFLVEYAGNLFRTVVLSGGAYRRRASLLPEYAQCWKEASGIAILTPIGYILVLFAMRLAPISHVAPMREMSMLIGMYFGARFLNEGHIFRRILGSVFIAGGVAALALG